jgi:hypothetical protein
MATEPARKRPTRADGERSYRAILDAAARLATIGGLDGLSIGRVANEIGMSKSGALRPLRLQAGSAARDHRHRRGDLRRRGRRARHGAPEGLERLEQLCDRYLSYVERGVFPGGCFFASTAAEWDTRPGPGCWRP